MARGERRLTGRPSQLTFGEQVHVKMRDRLGGVGAVVDHEAKPFLKIQFFCERAGSEQEVAEHCLIGERRFTDARDGFFWDDQQMNRRLGLDIVEHDAEIILVFDLGGDFTVDDALEKSFGHRIFYRR